MESLFVVEDMTTGEMKILQDLEDLKKGKNEIFVIAKITGRDLRVERWGTSANEDLYVKHF